MGAIAEGIVAYAQPLLDQTDGSAGKSQTFHGSRHQFSQFLLRSDIHEEASVKTKEQDDHGTSQTSIRHHPQPQSAMK